MEKRVLLLTGNSGIGKTTAIMKTINTFQHKGYSVGGMISREVREGGIRVGFKILDLNSGKSGWLAQVNQKNGPQIGKYRVNTEDLNRIGAQAVTYAVTNCAIIIIDEIGPMELVSSKFKESVYKALKSSKPVLAVVHLKASGKLIKEAKAREDSETFIVTQENRETLHKIIAQKTLELLKMKRK